MFTAENIMEIPTKMSLIIKLVKTERMMCQNN